MAEKTEQQQNRASPDNSGRRNAQGELIDAAGRTVTEVGAEGIALPQAGEHGGGAIADELRPDPADTTPPDPLAKQRRYMKSRLAQEAGAIIGRSPDNIGLWSKGETYRGTGILVNVDTMEKVRVYDGYRFEDDDVFANSRDLPPALVNGDMAKNLSGKR
jgi:hypothetical protein